MLRHARRFIWFVKVNSSVSEVEVGMPVIRLQADVRIISLMSAYRATQRASVNPSRDVASKHILHELSNAHKRRVLR